MRSLHRLKSTWVGAQKPLEQLHLSEGFLDNITQETAIGSQFGLYSCLEIGSKVFTCIQIGRIAGPFQVAEEVQVGGLQDGLRGERLETRSLVMQQSDIGGLEWPGNSPDSILNRDTLG